MDVLMPRLAELVPMVVSLMALFVFLAFAGTVGVLLWRQLRVSSQRERG